MKRTVRNLHRLSATTLILLVPSIGQCFYHPAAGRWLSRDPAGEETGGMNLHCFVSNRPIGDVDPLGLMRFHEMMAIVYQMARDVSKYPCCCDQKTGIVRADISGTASYATVTDTLKLTKIGCVDSIAVMEYLWWDCVTAQHEYDADHDPNKPRDLQAWQDYGWHAGSNPQTQTHVGSPIAGMGDNNHWNWQGAVIYIFCSKMGHYTAGITFSDPLEWTWHMFKGWSDPHEGRGPKQ
jgi:hypothetical protein